MAAAAFIDGELTKAPLVIFSKTTCGYCSQVKRMVGGLALPVPAHVVELNQLDNMSELQDRYTTLFGCLAAWLAGWLAVRAFRSGIDARSPCSPAELGCLFVPARQAPRDDRRPIRAACLRGRQVHRRV